MKKEYPASAIARRIEMRLKNCEERAEKGNNFQLLFFANSYIDNTWFIDCVMDLLI